jgi:hypothetical protein
MTQGPRLHFSDNVVDHLPSQQTADTAALLPVQRPAPQQVPLNPPLPVS